MKKKAVFVYFANELLTLLSVLPFQLPTERPDSIEKERKIQEKSFQTKK